MENQQLPEYVKALFYASARVKEIHIVKNLLLAQNGTKLAFQKLPRHMRRRVMGHCTKRVPKRIQQVHRNQLEKSGMSTKPKRPSRKYRRRRKLLNTEIARRQRENKWMETHIWHAKRFHMINKWAYKIPLRPTDKAFRACYRATKQHCLLQDISYVGCIELCAPSNVLIEGFKKITRSDEGLSVHAIAYVTGNRQGRKMLYKHGESKPLGTVTFNWKPEDVNSKSTKRTIWLWVHAAYFKEVLDELIALFNLSDNTAMDTEDIVETLPKKQWKNSEVQLTDLRFELNRFRLTGPLSQGILGKALQPANASLDVKPWLKEYLDDNEQRQLFSEQSDYWNDVKQAQTPAMLSPHIVFSLVVTDPRYNMPHLRTKALNPEGENEYFPPPKGLSNGAIWNANIREKVTESKLTNAAINELRSQLLVPGSEMMTQGAPVPFMLIQRPGMAKTGFCSGWDVIIPKGWAQSTWMCLIMWGARAGGLRETENINFEQGQQDLLPPDTNAGREENKTQDDEQRTRFFRLPPNKRTNFNKFSAFSPLTCNWNILLKDWSTGNDVVDEFYVLRNKKALEDLQLHLRNRNHKLILPTGDKYLVPVKITLKKGVVSRYTMICLPTSKTDFTTPPMESVRKDVHQEERNKLRKEHKALLQSLKRKRHVNRNKSLSVTMDNNICQEFQRKMRELWLPSTETLRKSASREILGFVTKGGVSLANGWGQGIGYIPLTALLHFFAAGKCNQVLCRNTNSRQYRCAKLEIIQ